MNEQPDCGQERPVRPDHTLLRWDLRPSLQCYCTWCLEATGIRPRPGILPVVSGREQVMSSWSNASIQYRRSRRK